MSKLKQITNATFSQPYLFPKFPAYLGAYCPHIFWHVTNPETKGKSSFPFHNEAIYSSLWNSLAECWSAPKRQTASKATFCILQVDTDPSSINENLPHLSSIYINPAPNAHGDIYPRSLSEHHTPIPNTTFLNPTPQELIDFAFNPNYHFNLDQKILWTRRLLFYYNSGTPEGKSINDNWNTFQLLHTQPDETKEDAKKFEPKPTKSKKAKPPKFQEFPEIENLLRQNIHQPKEYQLINLATPTLSKPYLIKDHPEAYAEYLPRQFWIEKSISRTTNRPYEVAYSRSWSPDYGWSPIKSESPPKSTVCVMYINNDPLSPVYTLPKFYSVDLYKNNHAEVYSFASHHVFSGPQKNLLSAFLCHHYEQYGEKMQKLYAIWASQEQFY